MSRRTALVPCAWLLACNTGIGVTDASGLTSTTSATSTTSSGPGGSTSTGNATTGNGTTGSATAGSATGSSGSTGTSSGTTTQATAPTTGPGSTTGTSDPGTGGSTTGEPSACVVVSEDHGPCDAALGYGFDGTTCRAFSGCDCAPDCEHLAPDPFACASACAAAGHCDESKIKAAALAMDPVGVGTHCDEVDACVEPGSEAAKWLATRFPDFNCEGGPGCEQGQSCHLQFSGTIDATQWTKICSASLLPGAELYCVVFGP